MTDSPPDVGFPLPDGRWVETNEGAGDARPLWLSDGPARAELWQRARAAHAASGLWPLLLVPLAEGGGPGERARPWASGELFPEDASSPGAHDAAGLLAGWWREHTAPGADDHLSPAERLGITAPFGRDWPGLAPGRAAGGDPDALAAAYADAFVAEHPEARLGLVAAGRGADAPAHAGWSGPVDHESDTAPYSAVLRGWEERFGARVVAVGFATLHLSVAAPPTSRAQALAVAAEHFAFCPDNIWQGTRAGTLAAYAAEIMDAASWDFWWD